MTNFSYKIERKKKGTKTFFYPVLLNGKRLNNTNYARKYDAKNLVRMAIEKLGMEKLQELSK